MPRVAPKQIGLFFPFAPKWRTDDGNLFGNIGPDNTGRTQESTQSTGVHARTQKPKVFNPVIYGPWSIGIRKTYMMMTSGSNARYEPLSTQKRNRLDNFKERDLA